MRLLDLIYYREKKDKRETKFLEQLTFIKKYVWKSIYGKEADSVEKHATDPLLYYIIEWNDLYMEDSDMPKANKTSIRVNIKEFKK